MENISKNLPLITKVIVLTYFSSRLFNRPFMTCAAIELTIFGHYLAEGVKALVNRDFQALQAHKEECLFAAECFIFSCVADVALQCFTCSENAI